MISMLATPGRMDLVKVPTFVCASAPWGSRVYRGWRGIGLCMMRCNNLLTKDFMPWRLRLLSPCLILAGLTPTQTPFLLKVTYAYFFFKPALLTAALAFSFAAAHAQNIAIVNGKAVPKSRVQALAAQLERSGRAVTPEMEQQLREEVIIREVFLQEAQNKGMDSTDDYKTQMELARQSILIRELFADFQKNNPVTDAEVKAEYDKFASMNGGKEYKSRHILVEKEDQAKAIIASLKKGGKFEDIAKNSPKTRALVPRVGI